MKHKRKHHTVYFAGEFYSQKHLIGNAYLAEAIYEKSHGRYLCVLPQNIEHRAPSNRVIRDRDIRELFECDLALFNFEGTEVDAGTLAAFMIAKFADIPSVILRSDTRGGAWTTMAGFFPRTVKVLVDSPGLYKTSMKRRRLSALDEIVRLAGQHSSVDAQLMCEQIAQACVRALDRVLVMEPRMPKHLCEEVYGWLALMPGLKGKERMLRKQLNRILENKIDRDLL
ncbi:MAG: nucleoside 2-deoxyribosyltransferase [Opitutaceae bacterium]|jgi:nucleoside 2-deoxyribosyltransferase|nr:nucleoside 2-deoxyribosyltransferase [Opitutaceae bacterium]